MKTSIKSISSMALLSFFVIACDDDALDENNDAKRITVQFEAATKDIAEDAGQQTIVVKLTKPAFSDAMLTINASGDFTGALTTDPAIENGFINIAIAKGATSTAIKLTPVDNTTEDGDKLLTFGFHNLPLQFSAGVNKTLNVTLKDDDGAAARSVANFIAQDITLEETNHTGVEYQIHLSEAVSLESEIGITLSSDNGLYGVHFVTEPEAESNVVKLAVEAGSNLAGFTIIPVDNVVITGELKINLTISETTGSITKGTNLQQTLSIKDDELAGKPKGYEITAGGWVFKEFYEYNPDGQIANVEWENYTPYLTHGIDTYHYDGSGRLVKITKSADKSIIYHWSNERIIRSDEVVDNEVRNYTEYEYDDSGNVGLVTSYHTQEGGGFAKGLFTLYLYFLDDNLFKSLTYQESDNAEEPYLVSTKTYDNYIDVPNPFPMSEILPTVRTQTRLATTYRIEEGGTGVDATYHMVYEYRPDGLPAKRIATATGDLQTAVYHYY